MLRWDSTTPFGVPSEPEVNSTTLGSSALRATRGAVPAVDTAILERRLADAGLSWTDRLHEAAVSALGDEESRILLRRLQLFPITYQARTDIAQAVADLPRIEKALAGSPLEVSLHPSKDGGLPGLRLYRAKEPVALSDVLPIIENLGLRVVAEEPLARLDYAALVDPETLEDVSALHGAVLLALAAHVGKTRLIDNCILTPPPRTAN